MLLWMKIDTTAVFFLCIIISSPECYFRWGTPQKDTVTPFVLVMYLYFKGYVKW